MAENKKSDEPFTKSEESIYEKPIEVYDLTPVPDDPGQDSSCKNVFIFHWSWILDINYNFFKAALEANHLLEFSGTTFLPDWQPPLIFVWFTSKSHEH